MRLTSSTVLAAALLIGTLTLAHSADGTPPLPPPPSAKPPAAAPYVPPRPTIAVQSGNAGKKLGDDMECLLEPHLVANVGSPVEGTQQINTRSSCGSLTRISFAGFA